MLQNQLTYGLERQDLAADLGGHSDLLGGGVALLGLLGVEGEEDELALVLLQAGSVQLQGLHRLVSEKSNFLGLGIDKA